MSCDLRIGCSGWSYEAWEGLFYPIGEKNKLNFYSKYFNTVEVDSTFYSFPKQGLVESWAKNTPENFLFSLKLPKIITHEQKLNIESLQYLKRFLELLSPIKDRNKLGAILIQLPPSFEKNKHFDRLKKFISSLDKDYEWAVEFRNQSWVNQEVIEYLRSENVAFTIVDEPGMPIMLESTSDFAFVRFHGKGKSIWYNYLYSEEELNDWSSKLESLKVKSKKIYAYFNNHYRAFAVTNALQLMKKLGIGDKEKEELLEKLKKSLKSEFKGLLGYIEHASDISIFKEFTTESRFQRAMDIKKEEIQIAELSLERWRAWVSGYFIEVDFKEKRIKHECQDWINNVSYNKLILCKHILAFLRQIPENEVKRFYEELKSSSFKLEAKISF